MKYSFFVMFWEKLAIFRWPSGKISDSYVVNALSNRVIKDDIPVDLVVAGDLLIADVPESNRRTSLDLLAEAFKGDPGLLRQFELYDYRGGRFVKIKRRWRKGEESYH